jgi:hypothetical protein
MRLIRGYDVIIVGGGPGGFGAAVAAGRSGARTLLIEREGCLGGGATTMLVHPFMPHWTGGGPENLPRKVTNAGVFRQLCQRLYARGAAREGGCVNFDDEIMKVVMDEMVAEAGVDVIFHAALFGVQTADGRVKAVALAHNGGPLKVTGKVFIDATGDALLAAEAGCRIMFGDEQGVVMPMTTNFIVGGVDTDRLPNGGELKELMSEGDKDTPALVNTHLSCTSVYRKGYVHFNAIRITGRNTIDPFDLSQAEIDARRRVENFIAWVRAKIPAFANCYLVKTGSHIGVRESRRVVGDYVLTVEDFKRAAKFDDAVACTCYNVDRHGQKPNETFFIRLKPGECYQVPYRCLVPKGKKNLLIASRSISTDVMMHASVRIMPPVMNIGEAAGFAAALSLPKGDVRKIDVKALQQRIIDNGGLLEPE